MKNKNMLLLGVAVGCGLVAAIVTARLGAGSGEVETVEAIVAKKELPVGTKLDEKELDALLAKVKLPKELVPPDAMLNIDELKNKQLTRTLKTNNVLTKTDVNGGSGISLPDGHSLYPIKVDKVSGAYGFAQPGTKVDVIFSEEVKESGKIRAYTLLKDMLVVAVDAADRRPEAGASSFSQLEAVSLAVTKKQQNMLALAERRGLLKLVVRGTKLEEGEKDDTEGLDRLPGDKPEKKADAVAAPAGPATVMIVVAKKDVPLNTHLTGDNIDDFFGEQKVLAPAPAKALKDLASLKDKYVVKALEADLPVFSTAIADEAAKEPKADEPKKADEPVKTPEPVKAPEPKKPARKVFEQTFVAVGGAVRRVQWVEVAPGEYRRLDDAKEDEKAKPEAKPDDGDKKPAAGPADRVS